MENEMLPTVSTMKYSGFLHHPWDLMPHICYVDGKPTVSDCAGRDISEGRILMLKATEDGTDSRGIPCWDVQVLDNKTGRILRGSFIECGILDIPDLDSESDTL